MKTRSISGRPFRVALAVGMAAASWILLAGAPLSAGVILDLETIDHSGPEPRVATSRLAIDSGRLKMDLVSGSGSGLDRSVIFRSGEEREILVVHHGRKTFQVLSPESVTELGSELRQAMSEALRQTDSLPAEKRELVKRMLETQLGGMKRRPEPPSTVLRTSERATHQGMDCVKYDVFSVGERIREVWAAPWSVAPGSRQAATALRDMSQLYSELTSTFEGWRARGVGIGFGLDRRPFAELRRIDGFPVLTRSFERGSLTSEIVLRSIREQRLDPSQLAPPEDYRQTAMRPD